MEGEIGVLAEDVERFVDDAHLSRDLGGDGGAVRDAQQHRHFADDGAGLVDAGERHAFARYGEAAGLEQIQPARIAALAGELGAGRQGFERERDGEGGERGHRGDPGAGHQLSSRMREPELKSRGRGFVGSAPALCASLAHLCAFRALV